MQDVPGSGNVFVNLHPRDFADPDLVGEDGALTPFAKHIVLEITERSAPDQIPDLGKSIARLRSLGFRLALDDLGAGYAGLSSFAWLEPEVVKVDMSLVRGIDKSVVKQKLFRSIHSLCGDLHADLIAEGIETVAERDCVCFLGADLLQGYLFARPARGFPPVSREPLRHAAPH
jgi:EAL domain-containing protein (putative c-di-GMP-specific phosphodiesterase class I)